MPRHAVYSTARKAKAMNARIAAASPYCERRFNARPAPRPLPLNERTRHERAASLFMGPQEIGGLPGLWRWFPALNRLLFPDIGGEWNIEIHWHGQGQDGVVDAEATIRRDFLSISMEVRSRDD